MLRFFDIFLSVLGLLFLSPILILTALILRIESRGSIVFRQERIGLLGKAFTIYKFRTMRSEPENRLLLTIEDDPRITRVGRILRRSKFDELPQLFNVLRGDMSIVGPRPEVRKYVEKYTQEQKKILTIKPGITDLASINFLNEGKLLRSQPNPEQFYENTVIPAKIELNIEFVKNQNLSTYFSIIFKTLSTLLHLRGKYGSHTEMD